MDTDSLVERGQEAPLDTPAVVAADVSSGLVPLIVGVTGHRDLRDDDRAPLEAAVREVFADLLSQNPNRPIVLLTAIAEGADTLVTRIALDVGVRPVIVLPLERADYARDFTGAAHADFVDLIDDRRVIRHVVVPPVGHAARDLDPEARRALQYALAGAYISHHCDALIALWDGRPSERVGGTAHVVHYRRAGSFDVDARTAACLADAPAPFGLRDDLLEPPDVGPVHHIVTPRRDQAEPEGVFECFYLMPYAYTTPDAEESYLEDVEDIDTRIRELNTEASAVETDDPGATNESANQLYPDPSGAAANPLPSGLLALRRSFASADALAVRYQRWLNRVLVLLFTLIFIAAVAFALFTHGLRDENAASPVPVGIYLTTLAFAEAIFVFIKLRRWQDKYQDYRAVAEGLRVQFYWRLAGLQHAASDHYVHHQRDELTWIPRAIRACSVAAIPVDDDRLDAVHTLWASAQAAYYDRARRRAQRSLRWHHAGSGALAASLLIGFGLIWPAATGSSFLVGALVCAALVFIVHGVIEIRALWRDGEYTDFLARLAGFAAAVATTLLLLQLPIWFPSGPAWLPGDSRRWLLITFGVTALAGAMLHGHAQVRAFSEHARRYGRLAAVFLRASDRMRAMLDSGEHDRARSMVVELGKESLTDHGDWVMLHRERPIELPEGGT